VHRQFDQLTKKERAAYLHRFIRYKATIDPRTRRKIDGAPAVLTSEQAQQLAGDILQVADFYSLPLESFLGIAAVENNFLNVAGDLGNAVWKRRAEKGDVVLARRRGRVLVLNESSGVWQITRETLRYVHKIYLKDRRDYELLPPPLRPPRELNLETIPTRALTTYAGLLFRDLLDHFNGDVAKATGAYNGGPRNPKMQYADGVEAAARHARRVMEQAAALHGEAGDFPSYAPPQEHPF
jgi:hypothetical protein